MAANGRDKPDDLVRRADAAYRGFPDFASWAGARVDDEVWRAARDTFDDGCKQASRESLQGALDFALRAAALDTGAIEGLYDVDRGLTFSVAAQEASWESDLAERGLRLRLDHVYPEHSTLFRSRLGSWVTIQRDSLLADLATRAERPDLFRP